MKALYQKLLTFFKTHPGSFKWLVIFACCGIGYLIFFFVVESVITTDYAIQNRNGGYYWEVSLPFELKWPVIPSFGFFYVTWVVMTGIAFVVVYFTNNKRFKHLVIAYYGGCYLALLFFFLVPNGTGLRLNPEEDLYPLLNDGWMNQLWAPAVKWLWKTDTYTNVFPSLHVYCQLIAVVELCVTPVIQRHKWLISFLVFHTVGVTLSTIFLKQHSIIDIFGGIGLFIVAFVVCLWYKLPFKGLKPGLIEKSPPIVVEQAQSVTS